MDLISRQAAIDALSMMQGIVAENGVRKGISLAWQQIKDLPSAHCDNCPYPDEYVKAKEDALRWIPVSERLPERNKMDSTGKYREAYLVTTGFMTFTARFNEYGYWVLWGYQQVLKNIIAWMPLPDPYKEAE